MTAPEVVAYVPDLMDRSRLPAGVRFVDRPDDLAGWEADLVLVDLGRPGALEAAARQPGRVIGFAAHVDDDLLARAAALGVEALPRSRFFRRVRAIVGGGDAGTVAR